MSSDFSRMFPHRFRFHGSQRGGVATVALVQWSLALPYAYSMQFHLLRIKEFRRFLPDTLFEEPEDAVPESSEVILSSAEMNPLLPTSHPQPRIVSNRPNLPKVARGGSLDSHKSVSRRTTSLGSQR